MLTPDLVLRNGRVVSEDGVIAADLAIVGDRIEAIGDGIPSGEREIDAGGKYVFPGGVDPHCHLAQVSGAGVPTADDFASGTRSAAFGGTTTVMAFAAQHRGTTVLDAIAEAMRRAEAEAMVDYGLHLIPTELHDHTAADLAEVARLGITSMKVFMTYERLRLAGSDLVEVLAAARGVGMTVMVHAEHDGLISWTRHRLVAQGRRDAMAHAEAHSRVAERAGVAEIVAIAEALEIGIYLVHLSTGPAIAEAEAARSRGVRVAVETCPHYLVLDESRLDGPIGKTAPFMCSPPLRAADDRRALWREIRAGKVDTIGSDHAPYRLDGGKLPHGEETEFHQVANGLPGVELRMPLLFSEGVATGRITVSEFVRLVATNPARLFGMYPRKGTLAVGSDADLVVWDDAEERSVSHKDLHDQTDYTPYEGMTVTGWPATVVLRGRVVVDGGRDMLRPGSGAFIAREPRRASGRNT